MYKSIKEVYEWVMNIKTGVVDLNELPDDIAEKVTELEDMIQDIISDCEELE